MPVSILRWILAGRPWRDAARLNARMTSGWKTVTEKSCATAVSASSAGVWPSTRIGASMPARRNWTPSSVVATPTAHAPASIAARATAGAPCP